MDLCHSAIPEFYGRVKSRLEILHQPGKCRIHPRSVLPQYWGVIPSIIFMHQNANLGLSRMGHHLSTVRMMHVLIKYDQVGMYWK